MLETLFKRPAILARYRDAPFLDAREKFLEQCALNGYPRSSLKKTAWILLSLAYSMDIGCDRLTVRDLELAIDNRKHFSPPRNSLECKSTRQLFVHVANEWARSLGLIEHTSIESPFSAQIAAFARYQSEERGLSTVTISTRCECLAWFFGSLNSSQVSLHSISLTDVDAFMEAKRSHGWKRSSLTVLTDSLRSFFRYAEGKGWCDSGIAAIIETPRIYAQEGIPEGPNWEDVQRLLVSSHGDLPADVRNYAIMMLLAVYGLRRGEVARLQLDDLDWTGERIRVTRSKIARIQYVPLVPAVGDAVLRYLREVRPRCSERTLFLSLKAPIRPLSAMSISPIVRSRLKALGLVQPHSGAHCLRHACAGHLLASGFTLKEIGDHLGHRSVNSTFDYAKIDLAGLREVAELDLRRLL
jgi:site-specific recombinase XerD